MTLTVKEIYASEIPDGSFLLVGSDAESVLRRFTRDKSATHPVMCAFTSSAFYNFIPRMFRASHVELLPNVLGVAVATHPLYQQQEILHELDRWLIRDLQTLVWGYFEPPPQRRLVIFDTDIY